MLEILKMFAENLTTIREFQKDPHGFLDRYPDLDKTEREILLEGDSRKASAYISGKINADTTIVVIVLAPSISGELTRASSQTGHQRFWDHVSQRSSDLAA